MKRHLGVLVAGMALSSFASAQLLGAGAGLGVGAGVDVRGLTTGAAQVLNHTAATVNGNVSAGVRSSVSAPPPAVYVESQGRIDVDAAARARTAYPPVLDMGSSVDLETSSSGRGAAASPAVSPRPPARAFGGIAAEAETRLDFSEDERWEPRGRTATAIGASSDARVGAGASVSVPRVNLGVRSGIDARGAAAVR